MKRVPQSVRVVIDRDYKPIKVTDEISLNSLRACWSPDFGYYLIFKILIEFGGGYKINITSCKFYATTKGLLVWKTPGKFSMVDKSPTIETNIDFYQSVLAALKRQSWSGIIGKSRFGEQIELPGDNYLEKAIAISKC